MALAAAGLGLLAPTAQAAFPGRNGRIALERFEAGNPNGTAVVSVLESGKSPVRIGDGAFPAWSASGRWLAFVAPGAADGPEISIAKANGSSRRVVAADGYDPAWAPNGKMLVFVRDIEDADSAGFPTLFRVNADGTGLRQLVQGRSPSWSPDGKRVAYWTEDSLWLIQADGKRRERIFRAAPYLVDVDWAPNGRSLLLVRQLSGRDNREIVRVTAGGRRIATVLRAKGITGAAFAPDGRSIVYSRGALDESSKRVFTLRLGDDAKPVEVAQGSRPSRQPLR